jgi:release factor glutamine methyltransferase
LNRVSTAIRIAATRLEGISETPRLDAELLMAHALGVERSALLLDAMGSKAQQNFDELVDRRAAFEPLAYITGRQGFWDLDLIVTPDVLIPRADSETLIEAAIAVRGDNPPCRIADLGTGSGALLLAALSVWPQSTGLGIDASDAALAVARQNAGRCGMHERAHFTFVDWTSDDWVQAMHGPYDLILANPPYVETTALLAPNVRNYEPHSALFAGADGLDDYRILIPQMSALLARGGVAIFEIGATQADAVSAIATGAGLNVQIRQDLAGHDRAVILTA